MRARLAMLGTLFAMVARQWISNVLLRDVHTVIEEEEGIMAKKFQMDPLEERIAPSLLPVDLPMVGDLGGGLGDCNICPDGGDDGGNGGHSGNDTGGHVDTSHGNTNVGGHSSNGTSSSFAEAQSGRDGSQFVGTSASDDGVGYVGMEADSDGSGFVASGTNGEDTFFAGGRSDQDGSHSVSTSSQT